MRLGLLQTAPRFGNKRDNCRDLEQLAGADRADLWIMPELALTGYEFRSRAELNEMAEEVPSGESCRWLADFCHARGCHAVMGLAERSGERIYNSCVLASPDGITGAYRKLHLFDREKTRFDPGDTPFSVYEANGVKVGLMICFDWRFPEAARSLALQGAQVIAHPSNLVMPYCQQAMVTRALENGVFIATCNRIGTEERDGRAVTFTGGSQVVAPGGEILVSAAVDRAACHVVEINPSHADQKQVNEHNHLLEDRRTEFYR